MKKTVPQSRKEALMLAIDKRCPWCGHDISAPRRIRGVCETCGKPYRPIVLLYNRTHTNRSETAVWVWYAMQLVLAAGFVLGKKQAYLKRVISEEEESQPEERFARIKCPTAHSCQAII